MLYLKRIVPLNSFSPAYLRSVAFCNSKTHLIHGISNRYFSKTQVQFKGLKPHPKNEEITYPSVLFIDEAGLNKGVLPVSEALASIQDKRDRFDLVLIRDNAANPVARVMERAEIKMENSGGEIQKQQVKEAVSPGTANRAKKASSHESEAKVKEVWIGTGISDHDMGIRINRIKGMVVRGNQVRIVINRKGSLRFDTSTLIATYRKVMEGLEPNEGTAPEDANHKSDLVAAEISKAALNVPGSAYVDLENDTSEIDKAKMIPNQHKLKPKRNQLKAAAAASYKESLKSVVRLNRVSWDELAWPGVQLLSGPICDGKTVILSVAQIDDPANLVVKQPASSSKGSQKGPKIASRNSEIKMNISADELKSIEQKEKASVEYKATVLARKNRR